MRMILTNVDIILIMKAFTIIWYFLRLLEKVEEEVEKEVQLPKK